MKVLRVFFLALTLASGALAVQLQAAIAAPTSQAPVPDRSCLTAESKLHTEISLAQARACAPEAVQIAAHGLVTKPGRYIVPRGSGYLLMGFGDKIMRHGVIVDATADQCDWYSGGTFREIYSWAYGGNIYTTEDSGNCVQTGWRVYNIWNSSSCQFAGGTCVQNRFVICNYCWQVNPGVDFIGYYAGGLGQDQWGIRQYLDANWNQSAWSY